MRKFYIIIISSIFFGIFSSFGQENNSNPDGFIFSTAVYYGFPAGYEYKMAHLVKGHTPGIEISVSKQTEGKKDWEKLYRLPETGLSLIHFDFRNPEQLGTGTGIFAFINFPVFRTRFFSQSYRLGSGTGYVSKIFDREKNYKDNATGAHFNILFNFLIESQWFITPHLRISHAIGLTHFSNGAVKMPNLGINIPAAYIGISYSSLARQPVNFSRDTLKSWIENRTHREKHFFAILAAGGVRDLYPSGGYRYKGGAFTSDYGFVIRSKRILCPGADIFYDETILERFRRDTSLKGHEPSSFRGGLHFSHISVVSRVYLVVQMGIYFYDDFRYDGLFYHRLAVRYRFGNHVLANVSVKTHWAKADYLEWGVGYIF